LSDDAIGIVARGADMTRPLHKSPGHAPAPVFKADRERACNHCDFRGLLLFPEAMMSNFVALIVEDDPFQRECLAALLKGEGLEVVECANGEVAELVLASTGPELRALVTDIELGGVMSGIELAQYAKRRFPDLNVVIVSGYGPPYVPHDTHFLMKPYEPQQLLDAVLR
jgi:CheY-like chemotaxis protein